MRTTTWIIATAAVGAAAIIALQWHQNSQEKQQVSLLQAQAAQQAEVNRAQQAELEKSKQRSASLARTMDSMTHDVAKARATISAARALPSQSTPASPPGLKPNMISEMMKDPDMLKAMRAQQAMMVKLQYGALVKQLNLNPDQADKFYQTLVDGQMRSAESGSSVLSGGFNAEAAKSIANQQKETDSNLQAVLGDSGFAAYKDYQQTVMDRTQLLTLKNYFGDNLALSDDQEQHLLQTMIAARQNVTGPNAPDLSQMNGADKAAMSGQYLQQQEQINQQVLAQAAAFLSPDQVQALGNSQSNFLNMTKASMAMLQKMMASPTNAATGP